MELTVTQENLSRALSAVSRVASSRTQLPILSNILLRTDGNRLLIAATNLEIANTVVIGAKVNSPGAITIPARLITEFVSNLPKDSIELKVVSNNLHIHSTNYTSTINGVIADDFPELPTINEKESISYNINVEDFKQAASQTIITASSDATRPVLTGVYWHSFEGNMYLAATDGYRLSERKLVGTKSDVSAIIPVSTIQEVLRSIYDDTEEITVLFDETQVAFKVGAAEIISRLIDGNFPDYRQLIPKESSIKVKLNKQEFTRVIKIASLFARESGGSITLTAEEDKKSLSIHSIASELGENTSEIQTDITGSGSVTLNSRYIAEALSVIEDSEITFEFSGKLSPCILRSPTSPSYYHVIMPLKS